MLETEHARNQLRSARRELRQTREEKDELTARFDEVNMYYSRMLKQRDNVLHRLRAAELEKKSLNHRVLCMQETRKSKDAKIFELKHKNAVLFRSERKFKKQAQELQKALNAVFDVGDINTSELSSSDSPPELEVIERPCSPQRKTNRPSASKSKQKGTPTRPKKRTNTSARSSREKTALSEQSDAEQPCSPKRKPNRPSASKSKQKGTPTRPKKRANTSARSSRRTRSYPKRARK